MSMLFAVMASKVDLDIRVKALKANTEEGEAHPNGFPSEQALLDYVKEAGWTEKGVEPTDTEKYPWATSYANWYVDKHGEEVGYAGAANGAYHCVGERPGSTDLQAALADLSARPYFVEAAPPVAEPPSRGQAPQREDLSERARQNLTTLSQPPTAVEHMKKGPKELTKEVARSAPEATLEEQALLSSVETLETEIKGLQDQVAAATKDLNKSLGEKKQSLVTTLNTLYELMDKNGRRVARLKDKIIAIDEKREIKSAALSPAAKKKVEEINSKLERKAEEMRALKEELKGLTEEQFQKYGGTETEQRRVTEAPNPDMKPASLIRAGFLESIKTVWNKLKSLFSGLDDVESDVDELAGMVA